MIERRARHKSAACDSFGQALGLFERLGAPLWAGKARQVSSKGPASAAYFPWGRVLHAGAPAAVFKEDGHPMRIRPWSGLSQGRC
jgi:hypothetical protein